MSCLFPIKFHRLPDGTTSLKESPEAISEFFVPCGQCGECRLSRARMWATRCVHEASRWETSSFITLTYKTIPKDKSLHPLHTRNFIRRLRDEIKVPFKYFLCGEYGDKGDRPHYHAIIFGYDFGLSKHLSPDTKKLATNLEVLHETEAFGCPELNAIWGHGFTSVGSLTFDSAAYVAQYSMKKVNGEKAASHYNGRHPEFMRSSRDPIGKQYALEYAHEIISNNSVISNDNEQPIPPYYLKQYEKHNFDLDKLKQLREEFSQTHTVEKSYIRAQKLDSKFKLKISKADAFRIRYAKDRYFNDLTNLEHSYDSVFSKRHQKKDL